MRGEWCSQKIKDPKRRKKKGRGMGRQEVKNGFSQWLKRRERESPVCMILGM